MSTLTVGTIAEKVTDAGVAVDGVTLKDGGATFTSAITATDNTVDLGASSTRFKDIYLSGGAFLGGTGSANKLEDYEEGTFIPTATFATPPSGGRTAGKGQYTKIGRLVTVHLRVENIDTTGASGDIEITGFPFTSTSDSGDGAVTAYQGTCRASAVNYASSSYLIAEITDGNATARITEITDNSGADVINTGNISDGASDILATISYTTAS